MEKTIYKYPLSADDPQIITMPQNAQILCVQVQREIPCIWALVNPEESGVEREFVIHGTGHPIKDTSHYHYIDTFQLQNGALVFHVFEVVL